MTNGYENWIVVFTQPTRPDYFEVAELDHENSSPAVTTVTFWNYAMFGAIGSSGILKSEVRTKPVTNAKERKEVDRVQHMINRGVARSEAQYQAMKAAEQSNATE